MVVMESELKTQGAQCVRKAGYEPRIYSLIFMFSSVLSISPKLNLLN